MKILSAEIIGTNINLKGMWIKSSRIAIFYMSRHWLKCAAKQFQYTISFYINVSTIIHHRVIWHKRIRNILSVNLNVTLRNVGSGFK